MCTGGYMILRKEQVGSYAQMSRAISCCNFRRSCLPPAPGTRVPALSTDFGSSLPRSVPDCGSRIP
eukprot:3838559-Rhodomonas_salina.2